MWRRLRAYLVSGLVVLIPLVITYLSLTWLFGLFESLTRRFLVPIASLRGWEIPRGFGSIIGVLVVLASGVFMTEFGGKRLLIWAEQGLLRLPFVKSVYGVAKNITDALFGANRQAFKQAALIEFPKENVYTIGFVTGRVGHLYSLFVPTTPNPTSGWYIMAPADQIVLLEIPVDHALQLIISGGVIDIGPQSVAVFEAAAARLTAKTKGERA